jgi:MarR family 2-MHQ and catechol resistance regulon transcriptional repressor
LRSQVLPVSLYNVRMGQATDGDTERLTTVGLLFESSAGLRRLFVRQFEAERSVSSPSFDVLIRLARTPGTELRMSELAAQTSLTPSGLTRSVDRLQEQGLVERRTCPEDRRGAFAVLTPAGRELMDQVIPEHVAHVDELLSALFTEEEEAILAQLLRRLRDHVLDENTEACGGQEDDVCPSVAGSAHLAE